MQSQDQWKLDAEAASAALAALDEAFAYYDPATVTLPTAAAAPADAAREEAWIEYYAAA